MYPRVEILAERFFRPFHPTNSFFGGTEELLVNLASFLASKNLEVIVYVHDTCTKPVTYQNALYVDFPNYESSAMKPFRNIVICINTLPSVFETKAKYFYFTNLFNTNLLKLPVNNLEKVITISNYQKKLLIDTLPQSLQDIAVPKIITIPHGINTEDYTSAKIAHKEKICLYTSSHDRGLVDLLKIWYSVNKETGYKLIVTYGNSSYTSIDVTGVEYMTNVDDKGMIDLYKKARFWIHPAKGPELFCISAQKAIAANTIPIYSPNYALPETIGECGLALKNFDSPKDLIDVLNDYNNIFKSFSRFRSSKHIFTHKEINEMYFNLITTSLKLKHT